MRVPENATYAYIGVLVDELARADVAHLCLCPGSRSTPLAISAARQPGMRVWALIDERSAAFFALGMAKALRKPVAVLSTSGTAAANFFPAVIEARYGRVPLIVLTADRPRESRDSGAPQTIDQIRLYGEHVKWFVDLAAPEATDTMLRYARAIAGQAVDMALQGPPGPVHLNVPLREPLVPVAMPAEMFPEEVRMTPGWAGRDGGRPYAAAGRSRLAPVSEMMRNLARDLAGTPRGVIVCGPHDDPALPPVVCALAAALGYPVLADPLSQVRCGPHNRSQVIDGYDAMLRVKGLASALAPDLILRIGGTPASKPLVAYLQHDRAHQVVVDEGGWNDPARVAAQFVHADPRPACDALLSTVGSPARDASASAWLAMWHELNRKTRRVVARHLEGIDEPFEGKVFAELAGLLPDGSTLYVGNSMPVRDLDTFFPGTSRAIRFLGNRGASGIDGLISSALGAAAAATGPVVLALGDLAFYHDMNGLLAAKLHRLSATIVLLNNDGGGIFSFLPQAGYPEHFEALFGTPTGLQFDRAAEMYGATFSQADSWAVFRARVKAGMASRGLDIVEVRTARDRNVTLHREIWTAVAAALSPEVPMASGKDP